MFLKFTGVTFNNEKVESNSIIQKKMPDGLHVLLAKEGRWFRIVNDSLIIDKETKCDCTPKCLSKK